MHGPQDGRHFRGFINHRPFEGALDRVLAAQAKAIGDGGATPAPAAQALRKTSGGAAPAQPTGKRRPA